MCAKGARRRDRGGCVLCQTEGQDDVPGSGAQSVRRGPRLSGSGQLRPTVAAWHPRNLSCVGTAATSPGPTEDSSEPGPVVRRRSARVRTPMEKMKSKTETTEEGCREEESDPSAGSAVLRRRREATAEAEWEGEACDAQHDERGRMRVCPACAALRESGHATAACATAATCVCVSCAQTGGRCCASS